MKLKGIIIKRAWESDMETWARICIKHMQRSCLYGVIKIGGLRTRSTFWWTQSMDLVHRRGSCIVLQYFTAAYISRVGCTLFSISLPNPLLLQPRVVNGIRISLITPKELNNGYWEITEKLSMGCIQLAATFLTENWIYRESVSQSLGQTIRHSINQSTRQFFNQSIRQSISLSFHVSVFQSVIASVIPCISLSVSQSVSLSNSQCQLVSRSVFESVSKPLSQSDNLSVSLSYHVLVSQSVCLSVCQPASQSVSQTIRHLINQLIRNQTVIQSVSQAISHDGFEILLLK